MDPKFTGVLKQPASVPILHQMKPIHTHISSLFNIRVSIAAFPTPKRFYPLRFLTEILYAILVLLMCVTHLKFLKRKLAYIALSPRPLTYVK